MSSSDPFDDRGMWSRILDLFSVLALGVALFGTYQAFAEGIVGGLIATVLCVLGVLLWLRIRSGVGSWETYALILVCVALLIVPGSGLAGGFYATLAIALVGLRKGFAQALAANIGLAVVVAAWHLWRDHETLLESAIATFGFVLFLMLGVGFGSLLRDLEQARRVVARHGAELEVANDQLRASIATERELVLAQERARSARDLHDGLGHRLTLVAMSLDFAQRMRSKDPDNAWSEIARAAATNTEALDYMRLWVRALDPPAAATNVGGAAAFDAIADAFRGTGLDVRVNHEGSEDTLPRPIALFATRLIQEGLTNVLRHAHARAVDIDISQGADQVRIALRDDGDRPGESHEGFGLRSLRARAEELGGRLISGPSALGGWEVATVLPLGEES